MSTNKIVMRTVEEFMADYTPIYSPIYPLFLGKSQQYANEVGKLDFRRVEAVGDIRAKHQTPKDTEIKQIAVMEGKKSFKKYFLANQYRQSQVQSNEGLEEVVAQVLDEHQIQMDELFLLGEGTSNSTMINNGLYHSNDANYILETSTAIASGDGRLADFHTKVVATAQKADEVAGRKVIIFYGDDIIPLFNGVYPEAAQPFKKVLQEVLGDNFSLVRLPKAATPSGQSGWIVANLDQCKLHYTSLPQVLAQGHNEENMYYWNNFLMGSMMLEVLAEGGVIRQPATLA